MVSHMISLHRYHIYLHGAHRRIPLNYHGACPKTYMALPWHFLFVLSVVFTKVKTTSVMNQSLKQRSSIFKVQNLCMYSNIISHQVVYNL